MSAHTPRPWYARSSAGNHQQLIASESTGETVAVVYTNAADAHLLAAAPDLLALLIKAVQSTGPFGDDTCPPWFNDACAAIAKATGGDS